MPARVGVVASGRANARILVADLCQELRQARLDRDVSQTDLARTVGLSRGWISRVERGLVADLSLEQTSMLLAAVGLRLVARAYPAGPPIRDAAHAALLGRLRSRLHRSLTWATEVPLPRPGDLRAWDAMIRGAGWTVGVEAETRPRDLQALTRRISLKLRDGGTDRLMLVLLDSRHNRTLLRSEGAALEALLPTSSRRAMELLGAGLDPEGNAVILI